VNKFNLLNSVRFEALTVVSMKNIVFWDVTLCCFRRNRRVGERRTLRRISVLQSLANAFSFRLLFHPEDGGDTFFRNVGSYKNRTETHPIR
jgi:hypothetical protein